VEKAPDTESGFERTDAVRSKEMRARPEPAASDAIARWRDTGNRDAGPPETKGAKAPLGNPG